MGASAKRFGNKMRIRVHRWGWMMVLTTMLLPFPLLSLAPALNGQPSLDELFVGLAIALPSVAFWAWIVACADDITCIIDLDREQLTCTCRKRIFTIERRTYPLHAIAGFDTLESDGGENDSVHQLMLRFTSGEQVLLEKWPHPSPSRRFEVVNAANAFLANARRRKPGRPPGAVRL